MGASGLLSLPPEICHLALSHCDSAAIMSLAMSCKSLLDMARAYWLAHPPKYSMSDLLQIERWPCYDGASAHTDMTKQALVGRDYFACVHCLRIRSADKFSNAMMRGKRGKILCAAHQHPGSATRFCIDCGITRGQYERGLCLQFGGARVGGLEERVGGGWGLVCSTCRLFGRICEEQEFRSGTCISCLIMTGTVEHVGQSDP